MSYSIVKSDGTTLVTLRDTTIDQLSTSITLIGKNVDSYGQYFNNNLVAMLENFASVDEPRSPLRGQLWYNKGDGKLYVYSLDNIFRPVAGATVSGIRPSVFNQGDLWVDSNNDQLYFSPDGANFILAGPQYSSASGKSGWIVETIADDSSIDRIVASLYSNDALLGMVSGTAFTFGAAINGMTAVSVGFTLNPSIAGIRFAGTATSADTIAGLDINNILRSDINQSILGSFSVYSPNGLIVGYSTMDYADTSLFVDATGFNVRNDYIDSKLKLIGKNTADGYFDAVVVDANTKSVGILTDAPAYDFDVNGDTRIQGQLIVDGSIDANNNQITNVTTCTSTLDAANKGYVDQAVNKVFTFSIDITGAANSNTYIISYLDKLLPVTNTGTDAVYDLTSDARARVLATKSSVYFVKEFKVQGSTWQWSKDIS